MASTAQLCTAALHLALLTAVLGFLYDMVHFRSGALKALYELGLVLHGASSLGTCGLFLVGVPSIPGFDLGLAVSAMGLGMVVSALTWFFSYAHHAWDVMED
jgi:hypothetical protein